MRQRLAEIDAYLLAQAYTGKRMLTANARGDADKTARCRR